MQTLHFGLQSRVAVGHLKLDVVAGEPNEADTLTKPLPGRKIREWSEHCWSKVVAAIMMTARANLREISYG